MVTHFAVVGFFKDGIEARLAPLQREFNEHFAQQPIRLAGALRDPSGRRSGFMAILQAESFAAAQAFLEQSPYFKAGLYEHVDVKEYAIEVGWIQ